MREPQLQTYTLRSHGVTLVTTHKYDWLVLVILVALEVVLNAIQPFHRFVGKEMMTGLKYPHKGDTVPFWGVMVYTVLLPIFVFLLIYLRRRDVFDLHHGILGLLFSLLVTGVITDVMKNAAGRPRPDFFWCCFPDGKDVYDRWGNVVCHGDKNILKYGYKSFPSGHTSWSFAGLGFLSLYLCGKLRIFDRKGHIGKLCIIVLLLLAASLVGISRMNDYRHHWQDVVAGGLIGFVVAIFCYSQFFLPPYHHDGWGTYNFLEVHEEMHAGTKPTGNVNSGARNGNHQNRTGIRASTGDLESGRG